ncbi:hypothetical protein [uncultured Parabacteroides sp.]|uniref:hypothetical protein n=1 Tax=uncultured Parabacteroides sp. TaxID=512312 RepID=UPI0028042F48|nr:hypothetical protein [uncultured Parabacteroides sp.]
MDTAAFRKGIEVYAAQITELATKGKIPLIKGFPHRVVKACLNGREKADLLFIR